MIEKKLLKDYMLKEGAKDKAFVSNQGEVYIVKDFRLFGNSADLALIDADLIVPGNQRKRKSFHLNGTYSHLHDKEATPSEIEEAKSGTKSPANKK
ncbi:MAG: hypothetical protein AABX88_01745 [Nanoarchaeota archaeon]